MRYERLIGIRHLMSIRGTFLSTLTILAVLGTALSVAAFTAVISVAGGFVVSFRERVLGVNPHLVVTKFGVNFSEYELVQQAIEEIGGVVETAPFILHEMLATSPNSRSRPGALVKGTDIARFAGSERIRELVTAGSLETFAEPVTEGSGAEGWVAVGDVLAERLAVDVGDTITLLSPLRSLASIGRPVDTGRATYARFRVAAIVHSGFYDYDNRLIVADYRVLQDVFGRGDSVTGVEVRIDDVEETDEIRAQIEAAMTPGRYRVLDWRDINRNLFRSLNLQKLALTIVMSALVVVGSSVILCVLVMLVLQKRREIAVLRSLGATAGGMMRIFMLEGLVIGAAGTSLGLLGGLGICAILRRIDFGLEFAVYRIDSLPVTVDPVEFALAGLGALAICLLATIYPSRRAASVSPVEVLRYD